MRKFLVIFAASVLGLALLYFSPLNRKAQDVASGEEVVIEDLPVGKKEQVVAGSTATTSAVPSDQVVTGISQTAGSWVTPLDDGSSITTVDDGKGARVESRFINGDRQIKGIIVNTAADGRKQVRIMLADGSSRMMESEPLPNVIRASPSQIASALGVFGDLTIKSTPTPFTEPSPEASPASIK